MKKTLILAAFMAAAVANATTIDENVLFMRGNTLETTTNAASLGSGAFSYTFTLSQAGIDLLVDSIGKTPGKAYAQEFIELKGTTGCFGIGEGYSSANGAIHTSALYMCANDSVGTGNAIASYQGGNIVVKSSSTDIFANATNVAITFTATGNTQNGTDMYVSVTNTDGTVSEYSSAGNSGFMWSSFNAWDAFKVDTTLVSSAALFNSKLSADDAKAANAAILTYGMYTGESTITEDYTVGSTTYIDKAVSAEQKIGRSVRISG